MNENTKLLAKQQQKNQHKPKKNPPKKEKTPNQQKNHLSLYWISIFTRSDAVTC